jgi:hypothetical protein
MHNDILPSVSQVFNIALAGLMASCMSNVAYLLEC